MKGTIIFEDSSGKQGKTNVYVTDKAALATLCANLDPLSCAAIIEYSVVDPGSYSGTWPAGKFDSVEHKMRFNFTWFDGDEKRQTHMEFPAPADALWELVENVGYRAVNAQGQAIATLLSTASGRTYTYTRGTFLSDPTKAQI